MKHLRGFTLLELLVVCAIIGILARIALPFYQSYVTSGKLTEPGSNLSNFATQMAQYYQDNHSYGSAGSTTCGVTPPASPAVKYFTYSCATCDLPASDSTRAGTSVYATCTATSGQNELGYIVTATSTTAIPGTWKFTLDDQNNKTVQSAPGISAQVVGCWFTKNGQTSC